MAYNPLNEEKKSKIDILPKIYSTSQQNITTNPATLGSSAQQLGQGESTNMGRPTIATGVGVPAGADYKALERARLLKYGPGVTTGLNVENQGVPIYMSNYDPMFPQQETVVSPGSIENKNTNQNVQQKAALFQPFNPGALSVGQQQVARQIGSPNIDYGTLDLSGNISAVRDIYGNVLQDPRFKTDISNISSAINKYIEENKGKLSASDAEKLDALNTIKNLRGSAQKLLSAENQQSKSFAEGMIDIGRAKGMNRQATSLQDAVNKMIAQDRISAQNALNTLQGQDVLTQQQKALQDSRFMQLMGGEQAQKEASIQDRIAAFNTGIATDKINTQKELFKLQQEEEARVNKENTQLDQLKAKLNLPSEIVKQQYADMNRQYFNTIASGDADTAAKMALMIKALTPGQDKQKDEKPNYETFRVGEEIRTAEPKTFKAQAKARIKQIDLQINDPKSKLTVDQKIALQLEAKQLRDATMGIPD